jgi:uncharacterized repeat protein (TIGR04052 family)
MSIRLARPHRIFAVTLALLACSDDTPASSESGNSADSGADEPEADGGKRPQAGTSGRNATGGAGGRGSASERDAGAAETERDASQPVDDAEQRVRLRFRAQVGNEPFACGQSYAAQGSSNSSVTPRDLRLFVQDVALVDSDGKEVPVKLDTRDPWQTSDVALLDFEDASGECFADAETNHEITGVVPKGEYRALRFSNGVPEKLNHSDPKTFPAPLQTPSMSWNWLLGLRFMRFEMGTTSAPESDIDAGADPGSFSLHVGSTACAGNQNEGTIRCSKPNRSRIELKDFDLAKSEIILDVGKLLSASDLTKAVECHSGTADCEPLFQAVGIDYATGEASGEQTAYRLK